VAIYAYLVYFSHFGMLHQEKSGNPALEENKKGLLPVKNVGTEKSVPFPYCLPTFLLSL
jgi:hypothetical protein